MARKFFRYPPRPSSGAGTFSDNIVGLQLVDGGGLTLGNFDFTTGVTEKVNRNFSIGAFSDPINLDALKIYNINESREITAKEFRVYPNFDLSEISTFNLYGSLSKRISTSVEKIINYFPASIEVFSLKSTFLTGYTAYNIIYDPLENATTFDIQVQDITNPFGIDFSVNATRNLSMREMKVSQLRNLTVEYEKYSLYIGEEEYGVLFLTPSQSLFNGVISLIVDGNPFKGNNISAVDYIIRPNDFYSDKAFIEQFDEVEQFLLNRLIVPKYTAVFQVPKESDDGTTFIQNQTVTWPLDGIWNIDIRTPSFDFYLSQLNEISSSFDSFRTNLIARFLTTESFKEFDTEDRKVQKILELYGRSFDEVKKFIDGLSHMTSVNYTIKDDIPSQLLKNLSETLGWKINISPIANEDFLSSVFGNTNKIEYPGFSRASTPTELNYQFYRNLILNSAYLFKSKGTRKSIEFLLRLVGAPEAIVEFNEHIYIAGQRINMNEFEKKYIDISDGIYIQELPVLNTQPSGIFKFNGNVYTAFTTEQTYLAVNIDREDFPVDDEGYPTAPVDTEDYYFQKGAGWFELVKEHQSPQQVNQTASTFTGQNFNIQTEFENFTYGQKYLDRFRNFPYISEGFKLIRTSDNRKSWPSTDVNLRVGNGSAKFDAYYFTQDERFILNVKNVDIFMNPAQGLVYDVWSMSNRYNYPIPSTGLTIPYPVPDGVDWTFINPQPTKKTFFEFAQTFWRNTINVRNRQFISDGKTGGYPTLQSIYFNYLNSQQNINIPNDNFTYKTMIDYVNGLGDYWVRLVEQMIPATTIWMTGTKYENSIFHRQKFVYRLQRGCPVVPVPCDPCFFTTSLFDFNCFDDSVSCNLYPQDPFSVILSNIMNNYQSTNSLSCDLNTLQTKWYLDLRLDNQTILKELVYNGNGSLDVPTNQIWETSIQNYLPQLINQGIYYSISGNTLYIYNSGCDNYLSNKNLKINVGLDFSVSCS
jgi:hypothetical protein